MKNLLRTYQLDLIEEVRTSFREGYNAPCIVLPCGGGKSVIVAEMARRTTQNEKRVLFLVHRQELCDQIRSTFKWWGVDMTKCSIMMVQTASRRVKRLTPPELIITDENHHSLARTYQKIYNQFPKVKRVGVTATPIRLNGGGLGDVNDKLVIGVTTKWLIENNYLAPFDYYAPALMDTEGLRVSCGDYAKEDAFAALDENTVYGDVIRYYRELSDGKQAICYCVSIAHSIETAHKFREAGITAAHIDGETLSQDRKAIIDRFRKGDIKILCNVDLISEGFDVPDCNTAILLRPTKSLTLFIQQAMRCMRYKEGKRAVIIDHVGNYTRFGLPDQERTWSLTPKKKGKRQTPQTVPIKQCPQCFYTHEPADSCQKCGYEYPVKERSMQEVKEAKLQIIKGFVLDYKTPQECSSMEELFDYARQHGYKKGWAYYQGKQRGII